jgi:ketosteroid isomerase-like protein
MRRAGWRVLVLSLLLLGGAGGSGARQRGAASEAASLLTGVYRINVGASDKLYTVVSGASADLPFGEQQRFFIDLAVRLTPPDLIAIERRGRRVTVGSSRSRRVTLVADGLDHTERAADGRVSYSRTSLEGGRLVFTSRGRGADDFSVIFAAADGGRRLRVTRRISAANLSEPVVIQTVYDKISDTARWDIYGEPLLAGGPRRQEEAAPPTNSESVTAREMPAEGGSRAERAGAVAQRVAAGIGEAAQLRAALDEWIGATNARDLRAQMVFYLPRLEAFYLARDVTRDFVRAEKARAFAGADLIDIRAAEPEIIFREGGRAAVMRFRKQYRIEGGRRPRRGEVVQELRWRRTPDGWRISSERDIRVIR